MEIKWSLAAGWKPGLGWRNSIRGRLGQERILATQRLTKFSSSSPVLVLTFMKHDNNCRESKCVIDLFHFLKIDLKCESFLDSLTCHLDCFEWQRRRGSAFNILEMTTVGAAAGVTGGKADSGCSPWFSLTCYPRYSCACKRGTALLRKHRLASEI